MLQMGSTLSAVVALTLTMASPSTSQQSTDANVLATVRIPTAVMVNGTPLPAGTYVIRRTQERPTAPAGQSSDAQRWVEFVADGKVVAREIAEVLRDDDLPQVGASSRPVVSGTRVDMLKGGEFLRISVKRDRERYLVYLPARPQSE
jgi:hypothetical protein